MPPLALAPPMILSWMRLYSRGTETKRVGRSACGSSRSPSDQGQSEAHPRAIRGPSRGSHREAVRGKSSPAGPPGSSEYRPGRSQRPRRGRGRSSSRRSQRRARAAGTTGAPPAAHSDPSQKWTEKETRRCRSRRADCRERASPLSGHPWCPRCSTGRPGRLASAQARSQAARGSAAQAPPARPL